MKNVDSTIDLSGFSHCTVCPLAKQHKSSLLVHISASTAYFELIHIDIWCPSRTPTLDGDRYFLTIVDDCNRFTWIFLLANKGAARLKLQHFFSFVETQFDSKIKTIRKNNGLEFHVSFLCFKGHHSSNIMCIYSTIEWSSGKKTSIYFEHRKGT